MAINEFDEMIKNLEAEITSLKTAGIKSSAQIATTVESTTITFTFHNTATRTPSNETYKITATSIDGEPFLASCSVQSVNFNGREVNMQRNSGNGNSIVFSLWAYGNQADREAISGGGSASASYTIDITSSSPCTLSVTT